MSATLSCVVDPFRSGWTLRDFLAHKFRYLPPRLWDERVAAGRVRVNGAAAAAGTPVAAGDRISYEVAGEEPPVDFAYAVLHEDDDCIAVAKSGNLPVHAGGRYIRNTLIARLRAAQPPERAASLVLAHRLDRETSGVVLLAKNREAAAHFEREFHAGRAAKTYLAVVRGAAPPELTVDAPIGRVPSIGGGADPDPPRWRVLTPPAGKPAVTRFRVVARGSRVAPPSRPSASPGAPASLLVSLVEAIPLTGRTHQIRIHAAHAGYPILGDKVHGAPKHLARAFFEDGDSPALQAAAGAPRHLLHAASLSISAPRGGPPLELRAPAPPDFALSWAETAPHPVRPPA